METPIHNNLHPITNLTVKNSSCYFKVLTLEDFLNMNRKKESC